MSATMSTIKPRATRKRAAPVRARAPAPRKQQIVIKSLPSYGGNSFNHNSASAVSSYKQHYKSVCPDAQMLVDQIIDPASQMMNVRMPTYGVSSIYTSHDILEAKYDANGVSSICVYPALNDAIFATSGTGYTQTLTALGGANNPYCTNSISIRGNTSASVQITAPFYFNDKQVALPKPSTIASNMLYPIAHAGLPATSPIQVQFALSNAHSSSNLEAVVYFWSATESAATNINALFTSAGIANLNVWSNVAQINAQWLSFEVRQAAGTSFIPYEGSVTISFFDPTALDPGVALTNVSQHMTSYSINDSVQLIQSAEAYFIASQSLLLTYEGSDLNSNGRLAIARLPQQTTIGQPGGNSGVPKFPSWYDYLASLSRNSYNGRVKTGGYCFYLGQDERSYFYRPVEEVYPPELPYIAAEWSTEKTAPQAVRMQITTVTQYTTNSNVYDQRPSSFLGEDYCKILHILSCINAAYDNPGHRQKLTDALKKVGGVAKDLLKDPNTWMLAGDILSSIATFNPLGLLKPAAGLAASGYNKYRNYQAPVRRYGRDYSTRIV